MSTRTSSESSTKSHISDRSGASEYTLNSREWPKICRKTGSKWDCLRPVPGYQGFGGMSNFVRVGSGMKPSEEEENWVPEVYAKMPVTYSQKKIGKQATA
jgi:hypothetical protein